MKNIKIFGSLPRLGKLLKFFLYFTAVLQKVQKFATTGMPSRDRPSLFTLPLYYIKFKKISQLGSQAMIMLVYF
jgi:hypothetical protein